MKIEGFITLDEQRKINPNAILLHSGVIFDVFNPKSEDIYVEDIGHALSKVCRFGGHCPEFYTVAQHAWKCSYRGNDAQESLEMLHHDSTEALGLLDLPSPIKHKLPEYMNLEDNLMKAIAERFGLRFPFDKRIKEVDSMLLREEYNSFFSGGPAFECWSHKKAKRMFLKRHYELVVELDEKKIKQSRTNEASYRLKEMAYQSKTTTKSFI